MLQKKAATKWHMAHSALPLQYNCWVLPPSATASSEQSVRTIFCHSHTDPSTATSNSHTNGPKTLGKYCRSVLCWLVCCQPNLFSIHIPSPTRGSECHILLHWQPTLANIAEEFNKGYPTTAAEDHYGETISRASKKWWVLFHTVHVHHEQTLAI